MPVRNMVLAEKHIILGAKKKPWFAEEVNRIDISTCEYVENQLYKLIKDGNDKAILFWLRCRARNKGYNERMELSVHNDTFVEFKFNMPDNLSLFPSICFSPP